MKERTHLCKAEFQCEITIGPNCDDGEEIRRVEDACIIAFGGDRPEIISLTGFVNNNGETLAEVIRDKHFDFGFKMVRNEEIRWWG
jgi:hypothetical protein